MNYEIESVTAREILDSRGNPTVEVEMSAAGVGAFGRQHRFTRGSGTPRRRSAPLRR